MSLPLLSPNGSAGCPPFLHKGEKAQKLLVFILLKGRLMEDMVSGLSVLGGGFRQHPNNLRISRKLRSCSSGIPLFNNAVLHFS